MRGRIRSAIDDDNQAVILLQRQLSTELAKIRSRETTLVELAADGMLPRETIRERVNDLHAQRDRILERLSGIHSDLGDALDYVDTALELLDDAGALYDAADDEQRRALNQALFEQLLIDEDEVTEAIFTDDFAKLMTLKASVAGETANKRAAQTGDSSFNAVLALQDLQCGEGSSSNHLVGLVASYRKNARDVARLRKLLKIGDRKPNEATLVGTARQLQSDEIDELVRRFTAGTSAAQLSKELGLHRTTVTKHLRDRGITIEQKAMTEAEIDEAVRLYESGLSLATVGARLGYGATSIRTHLARRGVMVRPAAGSANERQ